MPLRDAWNGGHNVVNTNESQEEAPSPRPTRWFHRLPSAYLPSRGRDVTRSSASADVLSRMVGDEGVQASPSTDLVPVEETISACQSSCGLLSYRVIDTAGMPATLGCWRRSLREPSQM
jgi:hypothetical protein